MLRHLTIAALLAILAVLPAVAQVDDDLPVLVRANPGGTPGQSITTIEIDGESFTIAGGGGGGGGGSVWVQYSTTGTSWHNTLAAGDLFIRFATAVAQPADDSVDWSAGVQFVGGDGADGATGADGADGTIRAEGPTGADWCRWR